MPKWQLVRRGATLAGATPGASNPPVFVPGPAKPRPPAAFDLEKHLVTALVVALTLATGLGLFWPSLHFGFHVDDYLHVAHVQGHEVLPDIGPHELFTFSRVEQDPMGPVQGDLAPWWASPELLIDFLRPLPSLTYWVDHALWGDDPFGFHVTNLLWWGALLAGVALLYLRLARDGGRSFVVALLAGLVFALDRAHEGNVTWIAGRYTLVSVFFCVPALAYYHRWRRASEPREDGEDGDAPASRRRDLVLALVFLALALLSSETPVGLAGFYLAYELSLGRGKWVQRARALAPVAAVVLLYVAFYVADGRGVQESSWYIDPVRRPGDFLEVGLQRNYPRMLASLLVPDVLTADPLSTVLASRGIELARPVAHRASFAIAALLLVAFLVQSVRDRTSRFLLLGSLIALLPQAAAPTPPRALLLPTIGISWVYAAFAIDSLKGISRLFPPGLRTPWALVRLVLATGLIGLHLAYDPPLAKRAMEQRRVNAEAFLERSLALPIPTGEEAADSRVLLVTSPSGEESCYAPIIRLQQGLGWPGGIWALSPVAGVHTLTRTGERTLRLEREGSGLLSTVWATLFRAEMDLAVGDRFEVGVLTVTVARVGPRGQVNAIDVELDRVLDDPDVWLMVWTGRRWVRRNAPRIDSSFEFVTLPTR